MTRWIRLCTSCIVIVICTLDCGRTRLQEVSQFEVTATFSDGLYHTLDAIYAKLNQMKQTHPDIVQLYSLGRSAVQRRHIPMVRMIFNRQSASSRYLFVAGTHGDEAAGVEALLYVMDEMLRLAETDRAILYRNGVAIYFVPVHNPDGFATNQRENGRGVDLNRNFPFGYKRSELEPETKALVDLINGLEFRASLFFHTANEVKYENVVRVPIELGRGQFGLKEEAQPALWRLAHIVEKAGNAFNPTISWHSTQEMVDASGIASDWCVGGLGVPAVTHLIKQPCNNPHPSVTVELSFPKQPMNPFRLQREKEEALKIVWKVVTEF